MAHLTISYNLKYDHLKKLSFKKYKINKLIPKAISNPEHPPDNPLIVFHNIISNLEHSGVQKPRSILFNPSLSDKQAISISLLQPSPALPFPCSPFVAHFFLKSTSGLSCYLTYNSYL
jgi:hypothetical protein